MTYETQFHTSDSCTVLELQMATPDGRDAYLNHFKSISNPGNGLTFTELANSYKSLWESGLAFPSRKQLMSNVGTI